MRQLAFTKSLMSRKQGVIYCYHYAMLRTVEVRFVPPKDIQIKVSQTMTRVRVWDGEKLAAHFQADAQFQALKSATLSKAEANRGQQNTEAGYLYLRYDVPGSTLWEFCAHWARMTALPG